MGAVVVGDHSHEITGPSSASVATHHLLKITILKGSTEGVGRRRRPRTDLFYGCARLLQHYPTM